MSAERKTFSHYLFMTAVFVGVLFIIDGFSAEADTILSTYRDRGVRAEYAANEIIVGFKGDTKPFRRIVAGNMDVWERIREFRSRADVLFAEPNYYAYKQEAPNDSYYPYQWHLDNGVYGGIEMEEAWNVANGAGIVVAVVDTGIAYENYGRFAKAPDFAETCFVSGYDFVGNDSHPNDDDSHGTHVAGTIAQSTGNTIGGAGVAPNVCLMPVKVLNKNGAGTYADIADGIYFAADNGARVINLSLGGPSASNVLRDALAYAADKGVAIVAAAGNDGGGTVMYPAAYDDFVLAVGATRFDETRAGYSNYGASLDLMAPGGDLNVDQNGDGYGDGVLQNTFNPNTKNAGDFGYWFFEGTSMATPHVAGVAALLLSHGNVSNPTGVRTALIETADDLETPGFDVHTGYGLINAGRALQWAPDGGTTTPPENIPPVSNAGPDQEGFLGSAFSFSGLSSYDADGTLTRYEWDFGDGGIALGSNVVHTFAAEGVYAVTLTVTDNEGFTSSDAAIVNVLPNPASPTIFVEDITFTYETFGSRSSYCRVTAFTLIHDENSQPVSGVSVNGRWSGAYEKNVAGVTARDGSAAFVSKWVRGCGTFTFTVNDLAKDGFIYDPSLNKETSASITF
ncbi:S8 family serine peptidase [bacterium]|nr:S8 family serine peptidase [bacterium]